MDASQKLRQYCFFCLFEETADYPLLHTLAHYVLSEVYFSHIPQLWLSVGESISWVSCVANRVEREPDSNECL